jgi:hypothetical protein
VKAILFITAFGFLTNACAATPGPRNRDAGYSRDVITREELAVHSFANMYDVVSSLRPQWIRGPLANAGMGTNSVSSTPTIYLDGRELGELEMLKSLSAETGQRLQYYSPTAAQSKFGTRYARPVIEVTTRGRQGM